MRHAITYHLWPVAFVLLLTLCCLSFVASPALSQTNPPGTSKTGYWAFRNAKHFQASYEHQKEFASFSGPGTLTTIWYYDYQDAAGNWKHGECHGKIGWSMVQGDFSRLVPGTKIKITASVLVTNSGLGGCSVLLTIHFCTPDQRWSGVGQRVLAMEVVGGKQESQTAEWNVPGHTVEPQMELRFQTGGNEVTAAWDAYRYEWVEGSPPPASPTSVPPKSTPKSSRWIGAWISGWGDVALGEENGRIVGTFVHKNGRLEGTLSADGTKFTGRWSQEPTRVAPKDAGAFEFQLSADGRSFIGLWWYGFDTSKTPSGQWKGNRK